MIRYIIKRLLMMIPIMIGVSLFLFFLLALAPGDVAMIALGSEATEEQLEMFREQNGLNDPLIIQYFNYMLNVVKGDLGTSYMTKQSVSSMIAERAGNSMTLAFVSYALTIVISMPLGVSMAVKQNSFYDNFMRVVTIIFTSMPLFAAVVSAKIISLSSIKYGVVI